MKKYECKTCGWHKGGRCDRYGIGYRKNRKNCWQSIEDVETMESERNEMLRIEIKGW